MAGKTPVIVLVPGFWEGPSAFGPLDYELRKRGLVVFQALLATTGTKSPGNPTIADAAVLVHENVASLVEQAGERGVIMLLHSAAGVFGSAGLKDLSVKSRKAKGLVGGVRQIVLLASILVEEGNPEDLTPRGVSAAQLEQAGVVSVKDGQIICNTPEKILFNDLSPEEASKWITQLQPEPVEGWEAQLTYMGWRDIPSTYILCEKDNIIPPALQEQFAALSQSRLERIPASHMAQVSQPSAVAEIVLRIAQVESGNLVVS
ncbi:Alpha/beta hydrolase fold-1 [Xylariales sp. AK1849]|nr:Alpha/beta hydrolase fold-1 [Xylariales sp. AK1849]